MPGREDVGPCLVTITLLPSLAHQQQSKPISPTTSQVIDMLEEGFSPCE